MEKLIKVRVLRGITLTDAHLYEPGKGQPPTFAIGDIVEVTRLTAQGLIGMGKAEYYSGPVVIPPAAYEDDAEKEEEEEPEVETAAMEAPETTTMPRGRPRKAG